MSNCSPCAREVERHDRNVPDFAECAVAGERGAKAVAGPETAAVGREEGVAFAFEGSVAGNVDKFVTGLKEPAAEVGLFVLALGVTEAADGYDAVVGSGSTSSTVATLLTAS